MIRKRWIIVGIFLALACMLVAGVGTVWLVRNIPGVARLVYNGTHSSTALSTPRSPGAWSLSTATLTPTPTPALPGATSTVPPSPTTTPSAVVTAAGQTVEPTTPPPALSFTPTSPPATPTSQPSPTPRPGWIAFETKRGSLGDYEILVMTPDGSRVNNLTNSWADDVAPVWSPDGRRIAFVSFRDTLTGKWGLGNGSIYIMDFDPLAGTSVGEPVRLTDDGGSDGWPTWSPDGKQIAFQSDRAGNWDIWAIHTDGSGLARLTDHPSADRYADWSPDGTQIAFTSKRGGNEDIWVITVQGAGAPQPINLTKAPGADRYAMWSPDGRKLTFNTKRDGNFEVYVMNADGSNPKNVSQSPKSTEGLADWSPDGEYLVLYSDRTGNKEIFVVDLASGRWTNISNHPASDEFCTWSP